MKTINRNMIRRRLNSHPRDIQDVRCVGRGRSLRERVGQFSRFMGDLEDRGGLSYLREVVSPMDRTVQVYDRRTQTCREMLMFASNNYLGLANHPYVREEVVRSVHRYGTGLGGPPLLCGYSRLMRRLEERISEWKRREDTMVFSTGYMGNLGLVTALADRHDRLFYDERHHASLHDATRLTSATSRAFPHNDLECLRSLLHAACSDGQAPTTYVAVEGVYSMDGDVAPLPSLVTMCRQSGAMLLLDDAHGSGVLGQRGRGTADHLGVDEEVDVVLGTFSKAFAATGGFVSASRDLIHYLRFLARTYVFSAAMPAPAIASVLAALDVIETEPDRQARLLRNARTVADGLKPFGWAATPQAAIVAIRVPPWLDLRCASRRFHEEGVFLSAIEYPAVPKGDERFRVSVTADHTAEDIERLVNTFESVWRDPRCLRGAR